MAVPAQVAAGQQAQEGAPSSRFLRIGELLLKENLINEFHLREALQIQKEEQQRLGDILVTLEYVTRRQLRSIMSKYKRRILLGEFMVESGIISRQDLEFALQEMRTTRRKLGETLTSLGIISEEDLAKALSKQLDMPYIVPYPRMVDQKTLSQLPSSFIEQHSILPLFESEGITTIVVSGPPDEALLFHLEDLFNHKLELAICSKTKLDEVIGIMVRERGLGATGEVVPYSKIGMGGGDLSRVDITDREITEQDVDREAIDLCNYLIIDAIRERASDIHLEQMADRIRVRYRIDGFLVHKTDLPRHIAESLFRRIKILADLDVTQTKEYQEGRIMAKIEDVNIDVRVSFFVSIFGETVTMRMLRKDMGILDVDDLGFPPRGTVQFKRALESPSGIVLITGPTGSGKTTTLYSSINHLNEMQRKIITVEDPVEYTIEGVVQGHVQLATTEDFTSVVRTIMHQDPDVIVIGEIFDSAMAGGILRAALTGHKIITTFHTDDTFGAILRLMEAGFQTFLLSSTSVFVVAQRLVRRLCPYCKRPQGPPPEVLAEFNVRDFDPDQHDFFVAEGCTQCQNTGYFGRTGLFELLNVNEPLRDGFLDGKGTSDLKRIARTSTDYITMKEAGLLKALEGVTSLEEILRVTPFSGMEEVGASPLTLEELKSRVESKEMDISL